MNATSEYDEPQEIGGGDFIGQMPAILWQRRWWIVLPFLLGAVAAVAAALLLPPVYRSSAVMLVQSSQLPNEVIGDAGTELIDRRIAQIREQITSRPDLVSLIERLGLYPREVRSDPLSEIVEQMRDSISLTPTVVNMPGNRSDERTIAFELAFEYPEAAPAQAVVQTLMDRILELQASGSIEQATNTVEFLADQAQDLQENIGEVQGQIASVTAAHGSILANSGVTMLGGNSGSYDVQIAALQRDNASLVAQKNLARSADSRNPVVATAESELAAAQAVYSENHPDVVLAKQRLTEVRQLAKQMAQDLPTDSIDQQIAFNNSQIAALSAAKAREQAQIGSRLSAQAKAPLVQQQISDLQRRLAGLHQQYEAVQNKLLDARAGVRAEDEQMGERLSVVEPPVVPDAPVWPNRLLIVGVGVAGGLGVGLMLALAIELLLRPIRDPNALAAITGVAPLGVIPILAQGGKPKRALRRLLFGRRART
jgi:uncharacterized protein involved in exopolysaccharide biosynthesis